jgi:hypothetical protein
MAYKNNRTKRNRSKYNRSKHNRTRHRYRRHKRGGTRYGTGIGANCYDPNQSIYNTNMLKLFPYKA